MLTHSVVNQSFKTYDSAQSFNLMDLIRYVRYINDKTSSISYLSFTFAAVDCNRRCLQKQSCICDNLVFLKHWFLVQTLFFFEQLPPNYHIYTIGFEDIVYYSLLLRMGNSNMKLNLFYRLYFART